MCAVHIIICVLHTYVTPVCRWFPLYQRKGGWRGDKYTPIDALKEARRQEDQRERRSYRRRYTFSERQRSISYVKQTSFERKPAYEA